MLVMMERYSMLKVWLVGDINTDVYLKPELDRPNNKERQEQISQTSS